VLFVVMMRNGKLSFLLCLLVGTVLSAATTYRSFDGNGNNIADPSAGAAGSPFQFVISQNSTSTTTPYLNRTALPNSRFLSTQYMSSGDQILQSQQYSEFVAVWMQFVVNDLIDIARDSSNSQAITVPTCDASLDSSCLGNVTIPYSPALNLNRQTSFLDGSAIYGTDSSVLSQIVTGGKFNLSTGVPQRNSTTGLFNFGDVRNNLYPSLQALTSLFMMEHNRKCDELKQTNSYLNDTELFFEARDWVVALIQKITYNEVRVFSSDLSNIHFSSYQFCLERTSQFMVDTTRLKLQASILQVQCYSRQSL
jgi:peroxidase